ncbi:MAG TPA: hypothetical protein VF647_00175 [Longimicrobium sp.]|jgi:hypothetical protein
MMKLTALLGLATAFSAADPMAQLTAEARRVGAVNAVVDYRVVWMQDTTAFDACTVFVAMGRPANFSAVLAPQARRVVASVAGDPCSEGKALAGQHPSRIVRVDSVALGDTVGIVVLTVRKGENRVLETYRLRPRSSGLEWGVRDVTLWGALRVYARPSRSAPRK